jgi:hypothetical protein
MNKKCCDYKYGFKTNVENFTTLKKGLDLKKIVMISKLKSEDK